MKKLMILLTATCLLALLAIPAFAADTDTDAFFAELAKVKQTLKSQAADEVKSSRASPYEDILRRLDRLEATAIDAAEAEQIAERVVMTHIKAIRIAINTADGGQRIQTATFANPTDTQGIRLNPGETLSSYTDINTGRIVHVGQPTSRVNVQQYAEPVPVWQTSSMEFRSQPMPVSQAREVYMRPVVQTYSAPPQPTTTYRRGLFGRQIMQSSGGGSCRMVNGQQVCN